MTPLEARAFNAVLPALRQAGEWLPLSARRAVAEAVVAELNPELDALDALRAVARGYCPHCGRGDAAPTVEDWERERQRADRAEAEITACRKQQWPQQLAHAEAAIARVRAVHQPMDRAGFRICSHCSGWNGVRCIGLVRDYPCDTIAALDEPAPAATQATDDGCPVKHCDPDHCGIHTGSACTWRTDPTLDRHDRRAPREQP